MRKLSLWMVPMVAMLLAAAAQATMLVRMSLAQLEQASTLIVRGKVVEQQAQWNSTRTRIFTLTTLQVEEAMKGSPSATVVIQQPGGTIGNIHVYVPGTVLFRPRADYVLFLEPAAKPARYLVVGMAQGALPVVRRGKNGEAMVAFPTGMLRVGSGTQLLGPTAPLNSFRQNVSWAAAAPVVVPKGTIMRVVIVAARFDGSGRMTIQGRMATDLFPSSSVVIPAGSALEGVARLAGGNWDIYWTTLSVRGKEVAIRGWSRIAEGASLKGHMTFLEVKQ